MSKEIKIGILSILAIGIVIWGFKFIKGQNLFSASNTFYAIYQDVDQLDVSAPILINGFEVGNVTKISLDPEDVNNIVVTMVIDGNISVPKSTKAVINSRLMGSKVIMLEYESYCSGDDCAASGDYLEGASLGVLGSLMGGSGDGSELDKVGTQLASAVDTMITEYAGEDAKGDIQIMLKSLKSTLLEFESISRNMNSLMSRSSRDLSQTMANVNDITANLKDNNETITGILENVEAMTDSINQANPGKVVDNANMAMTKASDLMEELKGSIDTVDKSFENLNSILAKLDSGDGSLAKLINDGKLYENLEDMSYHLSLLLQDVRLNPKRYASFSIFGKKGKEYKIEDDPALQERDNN